VMVGYGMAALFFRAFWPDAGPSVIMAVAGIGLYLWLGMAMSGPIALLRRRSRQSGAVESRQRFTPTTSYSWAELAWLLIGIYWILLGLFVIRARLPEFTLGDTFLFGLVPFAVALVLRMIGHRLSAKHETTRAWTHNAGVVVVVTWPIAWVALIILGKTLR
jgi:hypothetical protein